MVCIRQQQQTAVSTNKRRLFEILKCCRADVHSKQTLWYNQIWPQVGPGGLASTYPDPQYSGEHWVSHAALLFRTNFDWRWLTQWRHQESRLCIMFHSDTAAVVDRQQRDGFTQVTGLSLVPDQTEQATKLQTTDTAQETDRQTCYSHLQSGCIDMSRDPQKPQSFALHLGQRKACDVVCGGETFCHIQSVKEHAAPVGSASCCWWVGLAIANNDDDDGTPRSMTIAYPPIMPHTFTDSHIPPPAAGAYLQRSLP